ncbi:uncharacterized protein LOC144225289 [Crocuta crocuta]
MFRKALVVTAWFTLAVAFPVIPQAFLPGLDLVTEIDMINALGLTIELESSTILASSTDPKSTATVESPTDLESSTSTESTAALESTIDPEYSTDMGYSTDMEFTTDLESTAIPESSTDLISTGAESTTDMHLESTAPSEEAWTRVDATAANSEEPMTRGRDEPTTSVESTESISVPF